MKTLLVAVTTEDQEQASVIAAHEFKIYIASSTAEALSILECGQIDGIVAGVHFNDGDVFEFLHAVRRRHFSTVPFIVVRAARGQLHDESYRAIELACEQEGIDYIDTVKLVRWLGPGLGHAELRRRVREIVG